MHRWNKNKKHTQPNFSGRMCFFVCYLGKESVPLLLQRLFNGHSHGNGSADHGVVAHAQEAHHFHVKSACRRLCTCGARLFRAANPTFHKSGNTSLIPIECAFLTGCIISHHLSTKQALLTKMNIFFSVLLSLNISPSSHIQKRRK